MYKNPTQSSRLVTTISSTVGTARPVLRLQEVQRESSAQKSGRFFMSSLRNDSLIFIIVYWLVIGHSNFYLFKKIVQIFDSKKDKWRRKIRVRILSRSVNQFWVSSLYTSLTSSYNSSPLNLRISKGFLPHLSWISNTLKALFRYHSIMSPWQNMHALAKGVYPPIVCSKEMLPLAINF